MTAQDDLLAAWVAWERHRSDANTAAEMEYACAALASELGVTSTVLRARLAAASRRRLSRPAALLAATIGLHR